MNGMKTPQTKSSAEKGYWAEPVEMLNGTIWWFIIVVSLMGLLSLCSSEVKADYIYEANQDLYDLQTNSSGSTGLGSNDDSVSEPLI